MPPKRIFLLCCSCLGHGYPKPMSGSLNYFLFKTSPQCLWRFYKKRKYFLSTRDFILKKGEKGRIKKIGLPPNFFESIFFFDKSCNVFKFLSVLLSASVKRVGVSRMRDFLILFSGKISRWEGLGVFYKYS